MMTPRKLIAARGPHGFRPLCYGRLPDGGYVAASESCALDLVGAEFVRDVLPGEIIVFDEQGPRSQREHCGSRRRAGCMFEYIYFARPDSVLDGVSVHQARARAGEELAREHPVDADIVIGVPDSGIDGAIGYARAYGLPYGLGFIKNKYIARTFIAPEHSREDRSASVHIKLNPVAAVVRDKRVVLVDDSIVRGTTSRSIVKLLRDAGALGTPAHHLAALVNPCYYGTDVASGNTCWPAGTAWKRSRASSGGQRGLPEPGSHRVAAPAPGELRLACFDGDYPILRPT